MDLSIKQKLKLFVFNAKFNDKKMAKIYLGKRKDSIDELCTTFTELNVSIPESKQAVIDTCKDISIMSEPWEHILESLSYKNEDNFIVTAEHIKKCGKTWKGSANQFEPRLLAYQTSSESRPPIFKKLGLCILPIKNGTYMLCKNNLYCSLDYSGDKVIPIDRDKSSVILSIGGSETSLIDNLKYSGVFEREEILGEKITHGPMLNGRHRCNLDMLLGDKKISIAGVQYETDSCFESAHKVLIIEGKSSTKEIDSFNIRQLYFPFRECYKHAKDKKDIVCIFVHELKKITHIWKYTFKEPDRMDSIELCGHYMYKFSS